MATSAQVAAADAPRTAPMGDHIGDRLGEINQPTPEQIAAAWRLLARCGALDLADVLGLEAP